MSFFTAISGPYSTCLFSGTFRMLSIFLCFFFFIQVIQLESWEKKKVVQKKKTVFKNLFKLPIFPLSSYNYASNSFVTFKNFSFLSSLSKSN